jgi:prevent-host-death family protein
MKKVTSTEANRSFSKLLARAAKGEPTEITIRGKVVARLQPVSEEEKQREAAFQELLERLRSQTPMGIPRGSRDELYDD